MTIMDSFLQDFRQSLRTLRRDRFFAAAAVLIMALGIGANTSVFSIVESVLLRPLAYREPGRLYAVGEIIPQLSQQFPELPVNALHFLEWKRRCACFEDVAMADGQELNLTGAGEPERLSAARVTSNFFAVLGVSAQLGRTFLQEEGEKGKDNVVVLSDGLWRRRFGADSGIIGRTIDLNGVSHVVVAVLPPSFRHHLKPTVGVRIADRMDLYKPWAVDEQAAGWVGDHNYAAVARLPVGKTAEQAVAEFNALQAEITKRFEGGDRTLTLLGKLTPLQDQVVDRGRAGLLMLLAAVGTVLLIACLNVGNLMLVRATARSRETAIRAALGARRGRIFRGVLMESLLIACSGALLGLGLTFALVRIFATLAPLDLPRADEVRMDSYALLFALVLSIAAALVFALAPAWQMMRTDPQDSLRTGGRSATESSRRLRLREWLVAGEVGLSSTLLIAAGLLITSFIRLNAVDRGFETQNILTAEISLPPGPYPDKEKRRQFYNALVSRLEARNGVVAAGVASVLPLQGDAWQDMVTVEGDTRPIAERPVVAYRTVSTDYLTTMGIPLYAGRPIQEADYPRRVAVVSRRTAERIWPGQNPVGKRFRRGVPTERPFEVVGVAGDVRSQGLDHDPPLMLYVPLWERAPETGALAIRTSSDPRPVAGLLRDIVRAIDPNIPVSQIQTMTEIESDSTAQRRFQTLLVMTFAAGALLLAALGIYSVVAYSVTRRTNEIGIRTALGARPANVAGMVLRQGLRPVAIGIAAGVVGALTLGRFLAALLFAVKPTDPATFVAVAAIILLAALLACWLPARRAARVAPLEALRYE